MTTNSPDFNRIATKRLEQGDFQPLFAALTYRQSAVRILRNQGRDPALLDGIPDQLSHPVIKDCMALNNWDVSTIPNDKIQQLADRTRERIIEVLAAPSRTGRPAWATEVFNPCQANTPEGIRNLLYHDAVGYHGWAETLEALVDIAAVDDQDPDLVLRLQLLATSARDNRW